MQFWQPLVLPKYLQIWRLIPAIFLFLLVVPLSFAGFFTDDYYITIQNNANFTNVTNVTNIFSTNLTGSGSAGNISYWTNSTNLNSSVLFQSGNSIGLGTRTPADLLHINASDNNIRGIRFSGSSGNAGGIGAANSLLYFMSANGGTVYRLSNNKIRMGDGGAGVGSIEMGTGVVSYSGNAGGIGFDSTDNVVIGNYNLTVDTTTFKVDSTNNRVSIGTNSPVTKFHQDAGTATANYHKFTAGTTTGQTANDGLSVGLTAQAEAQIRQYENNNLSFWTANTQRMTILGNGDVGIGTISPSSLLHLSAATPTVRMQSSTTTVPFGMFFYDGSTQDGNITYQSNTADLKINSGRSLGWGGKITFVTDTTEKMRISSLGLVGINTTSPTNTLHVAGTLKATDYYSGDGTQGMTGTCTIALITSITVKDGLITGCS